MKKLLLIPFLLFFTFSFAQQNNKDKGVIKRNEPSKTILSISAYPNPFSIHTKINFRLTESKTIAFSIKNLLGKTVYLEKINAKKGYNSIPFNRDNLTKGMYIYSIQTNNQIVSKRLVIR